MDIHNSLEVFDCMDAIAKAMKAAKADGHVDWLDAPKFAGLILTARTALDNSEDIVPELSDLSEDEAKILVGRMIRSATALMDAVLTVSTTK